jgi:hypothetical protein
MFNRASWKLLAAFAAVLVIGLVACLLVYQAQERMPFVGEADPATGLRCRSSASSGWKFGSDCLFFDTPLRSIQQKIDTHLLHRPTSRPLFLFLGQSPVDGLRGFCLREGYPELIHTRQLRMLTHCHLQIDGYPATMMRFDAVGPPPYHLMCLFVYVPIHSTVYTIYGNASPSDSAQIDREMKGVIASCHIEKVTVPAGGKR